MHPYETLRVEHRGSTGIVKLHRPERLNAWTPVMGKELVHALRTLDGDANIRVVVLVGEGRAFCSGADLDFFRSQWEKGEREGGVTRSEEFPLLMRHLRKPSIAALHGYALGIGATMALLCDLRIASRETKIGFLFARLGLMAELGSTYILPRLVGLARASELLFTGKMYSAEQCAAWGLINQVVAEGKVLETALQLAEEISECAPLSLQLTRQALYDGLENSFPGQLRVESLALHYLYSTSDHAEALQALRDQRPPRFTGR